MVSVLNIGLAKPIVCRFELFSETVFLPNLNSSCCTVHQESVISTP